MRKCIRGVVLLTCLVTGIAGHAQTDPHFSQYYVYPLWLNPALTGAIDGDYRVTAVYRNQWSGFGNAFTTPGITADFVTGKNMNLGLNIMNQQTGSGGYNYLNAYATMAYTGVRFGDHQVSMGMAFGLLNRRFDPSKFTTGDQWNPVTGADPDIGFSEPLGKTAAMSFDAGAGIMYSDGTAGKKANVFLGFSAFHLTQPQDPFLSGGEHQKMPIRFTGHGGVRLSINEQLTVIPNVLYMRQGNADEKMIGGYVQMQIDASSDFLVGANYRMNDAIAPFAGFYYKNMVIGVSYDVNISELSKAGNANSFEVSLTFIRRKRVTTFDSYPFINPRF